MRALVCGGRDYDDVERAYEVLDGLHAAQPMTCIVHGCARGADSIGAMWADERGVRVAAFPAGWTIYGRAAGPIRNRQMLTEGKPDLVIAFPGGRGTADMVSRAKAAGVKVIEVSA